jgi:hypothetical protein
MPSLLKKIFYKSAKGEVVRETAGPSAPLWSSSEEFDEGWKRRIAAMASHIKTPCSVADFGCGMMWLEQLLPPGSTYVPIDLVRRDDRTIVLDLNRDALTSIHAEVAFLSGVLEYVENVELFTRKLSDAGFRKIILSYCTLEKFGDLNNRRGLNWVSHKSLYDLLAIFLPEFALTALDDINGNTILIFNRKDHEGRAV